MDDPIFRMRAKVAKKAKGHVFEERFLSLEGIQLAIAYRQAVKEEESEYELIKTLNEKWSTKFDNLFKALFMFTNPKLYAAYEENKEMQKLREEVKEEDFPELWEELMKSLPEQIIVEDPEADTSNLFPSVDPETEEVLAGFVPYNLRKDGE